MRVSDVLTDSTRAIVVRLGVVLLVASGLMAASLLAFRVRVTYALEAKVAQVESTHRELLLQCTSKQTEIAQRLDTLERVLFGDVLPKVNQPRIPPPTSRIESMMLRNEKELRARVEALERWRLRMVE